MRLSTAAVKNPQLTLVVFAMLVALGVSSALSIPRAEDPVFPMASFTVVAVYPGASPSDLEQLVVDPLEDSFEELDDVKEVSSQMEDGLAQVEIEFESSSDVDDKHAEVLRQVTATRPRLPSGLVRLEVIRHSASNVSVVQLALVGPHVPARELERRADDLSDRLGRVAGVKKAEVFAAAKQEVRVSLDPERLARVGVSLDQVLQALTGANLNIPAGSVDVGTRRFNVKTGSEFTSLEQVRATVVAGGASGVVRVSDVAEVSFRDQDAVHLGRYNGERAAFVGVTQKDGGNVFAVRDAVLEVARAWAEELPSGMRLETGFDQSLQVKRRLGGFAVDFALALALVLVTLLPLGFRASLVVMVSIPLSLALGLAALHHAGFTLNQLSIVGFVIALGLLVDDSIVVVENIARFLRMGRTRVQAAIEGTSQIGLAVLGCTATLVLAFVPLVFLPGTSGQFIRGLPMAVVFTILASLLVSLTVIPLLSSLVLSKDEHPEGNRVLRWLHHGIERVYRPVLHRALARPVLTLGVAAGLFAGSLALVPVVGFSLFPKAGAPMFYVQVETPEGTSLSETDRAVRFVEDVLRRRPEVRSVSANAGRGQPSVYYNVQPSPERPNVGEVFAQLESYDARQTPALLDLLRAELSTYPGARIEVREFEQGPPIEAPVAVRLVGPELEPLRELADRTQRVLESTPGTLYVKNPVQTRRTDLQVEVDREKAGRLGVPAAEVARAVRFGLAGLPAGSFRDEEGDDHPILVRLPLESGAWPALGALERLHVASVTGAQVPLGQVTRVRLEAGPNRITHHEGERSVTVSASVATGFINDNVIQEAVRRLDAEVKPPAGYRLEMAGELKSRQESFDGVSAAGIIAAFGVLAVLVLEFRTFRGALIVASVIPLGLVGGIAALWLTGNTLSFTASIGFIALVGIEVKNSILLVDFTNQLRARGLSVDAAIEQAGETRFLPILLTTLTALGGLLPLALENSSLYSPLAWVIIGGLISSTVLTRVVTPVVYKLLAPEVEPEAEAREPAVSGGSVLSPGGAV
ncbi:efflux RND transporter permease subunit [Myxococcus sp. XM-1-1-1]|uniref:efflux RND transporter permease subunit n=1 Tax=Myxococcus sp. XM-1-1-1 TaxID=2874602 RepID=UPI001CC1A32C|nr:efflux RND transporter permease subunit [Myxococcus sp. XM-1-1-1]MBZ4410339.1 efflux RND transporter permease subunit [Myxococcus sp. XM-1-1-1]